jgi:phage replication O-like protein O
MGDRGHIEISNEIVDKLCSYRLSGEEWQVLWVIIRKTFGWQKEADWISLSQFETLTGIKKSNIIRTLKKLLSKNIVIKIDNGDKTKYAFNRDFDTWEQSKALSKKIPTIYIFYKRKYYKR